MFHTVEKCERHGLDIWKAKKQSFLSSVGLWADTEGIWSIAHGIPKVLRVARGSGESPAQTVLVGEFPQFFFNNFNDFFQQFFQEGFFFFNNFNNFFNIFFIIIF